MKNNHNGNNGKSNHKNGGSIDSKLDKLLRLAQINEGRWQRNGEQWRKNHERWKELMAYIKDNEEYKKKNEEEKKVLMQKIVNAENKVDHTLKNFRGWIREQ